MMRESRGTGDRRHAPVIGLGDAWTGYSITMLSAHLLDKKCVFVEETARSPSRQESAGSTFERLAVPIFLCVRIVRNMIVVPIGFF